MQDPEAHLANWPTVEQADIDLARFSRLSADAQARFDDAGTDAWAASPFLWIRPKASRSKGAIGESLVKEWAGSEGVRVEPATNTGHDCRLDGVPVEVKVSLRWRGGHFAFQQVRDQDYEVACLLGLEPQRVRLWAVPKAVLWEHAIGQHSGAAARDTKWLRFKASSPPAWLAEFGGTLPAARAALEEARGKLGR